MFVPLDAEPLVPRDDSPGGPVEDNYSDLDGVGAAGTKIANITHDRLFGGYGEGPLPVRDPLGVGARGAPFATDDDYAAGRGSPSRGRAALDSHVRRLSPKREDAKTRPEYHPDPLLQQYAPDVDAGIYDRDDEGQYGAGGMMSEDYGYGAPAPGYGGAPGDAVYNDDRGAGTYPVHGNSPGGGRPFNTRQLSPAARKGYNANGRGYDILSGRPHGENGRPIAVPKVLSPAARNKYDE